MSTRITVITPVPVSPPPAVAWIGSLIDTTQAFGKAWRATVKARQLARDTAELRAYVAQLERTDPGMAADLRAALDRQRG